MTIDLRDPEYRKQLDLVHETLWQACIKKPQDYDPWGQQSRDDDERFYSDCSCGCKHFHVLNELPLDWGVCTNSQSHRCGLLTFEHQGCLHFENDDAYDAQEQLLWEKLKRLELEILKGGCSITGSVAQVKEVLTGQPELLLLTTCDPNTYLCWNDALWEETRVKVVLQGQPETYGEYHE